MKNLSKYILIVAALLFSLAPEKIQAASSDIRPVSLEQLPDPGVSITNLTLNQSDSIFYFLLKSNYPYENLILNNSSTTLSTNLSYRFEWGDKTPEQTLGQWTSITHKFNAGHTVFKLTVTGTNGVQNSKTYHVYIVSNPAISMGNPGNTDNCSDIPVSFPITGTENNPPNTIYTVSFNDGTAPQVFTQAPTEITHIFKQNSCGITSVVGNSSYANSFSATIIAENSCGKSAVNVVPIYVSTSPIVDFFTASENVAIEKPVKITNTTTGYVNEGKECKVPKFYWEISPSTGYTLSKGSLGKNPGSDNSFFWTNGSEEIIPIFTTPGIYTIKLRADTKRCGTDSIVKTLCVEAPVDPQFGIDVQNGCYPLIVKTHNNTRFEGSCSAKGKWQVSYSPANGGNAPATWSFMNGTTTESTEPQFVFHTPGIYRISYQVTNSAGTLEKSEIVYVNQAPVCKINPLGSICLGEKIRPTAQIVIGTQNTQNVSYEWQFEGGEPSTSTAANPGDILFNTAGTHIIRLKVMNDCGETWTESSLVVNASPEINPVNDITGTAESTLNEIVFSGSENADFEWTNSNTSIGLAGSGVGNIAPFKLKNSTFGVIKSTIIVTPKFKLTGCNGKPISFTISVNPISTMNVVPNVIVSNQDQVSEIPFTSKNSGGTSTFEWTASESAIGIAASGTGNIPAFKAVNTSNKPLISTITVTPVFSNGSVSSKGAPQSFTITVLPTAQVNPLVDLEFCNGIKLPEIRFSTNNEEGLTSYQWTCDNPTMGLATSGTGNIRTVELKNQTTSSITAKITVTPTYCLNGICNTGNPETFSITVHPGASITRHPESYSICSGAKLEPLTVEYSAGSGDALYQWYVNDVNSNANGQAIAGATSSSFSPSTDKTGTRYYYCVLSFSNGVCREMASDVSVISVNELAAITEQPQKSQTLCVGGTNSLKVQYTNGAGVASFKWYENSTNSIMGAKPINYATDSIYTPAAFTVPGKYYYFVEITMSGNGCGSTFSDIAEIIVVPDPTIELQPYEKQIVCHDAAIEPLKVRATGGTGTFTYQWYANSINDNTSGKAIAGMTDSIFTPSTSTTGTMYYYCIISQSPSGGCVVVSNTASVTVSLTPAITTQPAANTVLCSGESTIELSVIFTNGVGIPRYQWYENSIRSNLSGTPITGATKQGYIPDNTRTGTTYYYCLIDFPEGGCTSLLSDVASVTVNPVAKINSKKMQIASGEAFTYAPEDEADNIVPKGTQYTWTSPKLLTEGSLNGANEQLSPTSLISQTLSNSGNQAVTIRYIVSPTTENCKGADFTIDITVLPKISVTATVYQISCIGSNDGKISLNITGGNPLTTGEAYKIEWKSDDRIIGNQKEISNLKPGKYTVEISDQSNVEKIDFQITEPSPITINTINKQNLTCAAVHEGKIEVSVSGGTAPYKYFWKMNGSRFEGSESISNLSAGIYELSVTDARNCDMATETYLIESPEPLTIELLSKTDIRCAGDSTAAISLFVKGGNPIEFEDGKMDYRYNWTGPNGFMHTQKDLRNLAKGLYTLVVTDANNCQTALEVNIEAPEELKIEAQIAKVSCSGTNNGSISLTVSGGTQPYDISWSNLGKGLTQNNLSPGDYFVTVIDAANCEKTVKFNIPEPQFTIHPIIKNVSCFGSNNGSINLQVTGGVKPVKLVWSDNPTAGQERNLLSPGLYTVSLRDASNCEISATFMITEPEPLRISGKTTNAYNCDYARNGEIDVTVSGGTLPYKYQWSNGAKSEDAANLPAGKYTLLVTDANGCTVTEQFEVANHQPIAATIQSTIEFDAAKKTLKTIIKASVSGGMAPYSIVWSSGKAYGDNNEIVEISRSSLVELVITDSKGCSSTRQINVDVPVLGINYKMIDCNRKHYQFNAIQPPNQDPGLTYEWEFGDGLVATGISPSHWYSEAGNYKVKLRISVNGQSAVFEQIVRVATQSILKLDREPVICHNDSAVIHVSGAKYYKWSDGTMSDSLIARKAGEYAVVGYTNDGCTDTLNFVISNCSLYSYPILCDSDKVSSGGFPLRLRTNEIPYSKYSWDFGDGTKGEGVEVTHTFNTNNDGYYDVTLTVTNPNGCIETTVRRIWVYVQKLPNTFSPNGDGINDKFFEGWHIKVYNRNSMLLYDGKEGWDGKYKNQDVIPGVYFFVLYYPGAEGIKTASGYVRVIR